MFRINLSKLYNSFKIKKGVIFNLISIKKNINNLIVFCLIFSIVFSNFYFAKGNNDGLFVSTYSEAIEIEEEIEEIEQLDELEYIEEDEIEEVDNIKEIENINEEGIETSDGFENIDNTENSSLIEKDIKKENNNLYGSDTAPWQFSAFGSGVNTTDNGYSGSYESGEVELFSLNNKGKLVPKTTDGLSFYYTSIDPKTKNFKLSADVEVVNWELTNGQEGFGLMACDRVGENGNNKTFWNNSYMASVTKVEYKWDGTKVSNVGKTVTMKLGIGSQEKKGVTLDNIDEALNLKDMTKFSSRMKPLEISCATKVGDAFNIVGNFINKEPVGTQDELITNFKLAIEKNNTGYFVSYTNDNGEVTTYKYYEPDALSMLDEDNVYLGFFAARRARVKFKNISFTTSNKEDDDPPEEKPIIYIDPNYKIISSKYSNTEEYEMVFIANADGNLKVTDANTTVLYDNDILADTKTNINLNLIKGANSYEVEFDPDENYESYSGEKLNNYDTAYIDFTVTYDTSDRNITYVSPDGVKTNEGTKESPKNLKDSLNSAMPGQTIIMLGGRYILDEQLVIDRGINGTSDKYINLFADDTTNGKPVIDFNLNGKGMVLAGNYWHLKGFDIVNSKDMSPGLKVSGKNNKIELLNLLYNGNTGLAVSRYQEYDDFSLWPSDNLILNCTSMYNTDRGHEDADGFAAKITCGEGNVFDGCISAYNADDGFDLFAKLENGSIGKVTIKNSVVYKNGYLFNDDGEEYHAGNGNGYKLGGESLSGYHTLINSIAFLNGANGIDSNNCPDVQLERCTSFDNEKHNVALYTKTALNTDFSVNGVISYKKTNTVLDDIQPVGSQDLDKIYKNINYYYLDDKFENNEGDKVEDNWFTSLDATNILKNGIKRNSDGSITLNGFLQLTNKSKPNTGAVFDKIKSDDNNNNNNIYFNYGSDSSDSGSGGGPAISTSKNPLSENLIKNENFINMLMLDIINQNSRTDVIKDIYNNQSTGRWLKDINTGKWYFQIIQNNNTGLISNGWYKISWQGVEYWYHFDKNGMMDLGWFKDIDNKIYYLQAENADNKCGSIAIGEIVIDGVKYLFDKNGVYQKIIN